MLADLACLEEIVTHSGAGLGGVSRQRAFDLLREIERFMTADPVLGNLRLELSISVRAIPPPTAGSDVSMTREVPHLWQGQALEAIRTVRAGLAA